MPCESAWPALRRKSTELVSAVAAKLCSRRVIKAAAGALSAGNRRRRGQIFAAIIAEANGLRVFRTASGAFLKLHVRAAVVAELAASGRLAAGGANRGLALDGALPDGGRLSRLADIALQGIGPGSGDQHLLARGAGYAEALVLIPAMVTHILIAARAAMEMLPRFVLRTLKGLLVFLLPLGAFALEALRENIAAPLRRVGKLPRFSAKQASGKANSLTQKL